MSAYEMDGVIGIYIANDQPGKTVKCNLKVSVIRWKDASFNIISLAKLYN